MALVKDTNVENVINEATPGGIIKAEHIDTIANKVLYQKNVQTGDSLPSASGYSEGDIFTVQGGATYKHNGNAWTSLSPQYYEVNAKVTIPMGNPEVEKTPIIEYVGKKDFDVIVAFNRDDSFNYFVRPILTELGLNGTNSLADVSLSLFDTMSFKPINITASSYDFGEVILTNSNLGDQYTYLVKIKIYPTS